MGLEHVVLLGDSIFDNASYVPGGEPVIDQLRARLPRGARASLLAIDGAVVGNVRSQLARLPAGCSHCVISVGGNDALGASPILEAQVSTAAQVFAELAQIQAEFFHEYEEMLQAVLTHRKPMLVCTIYDSIPGLSREAVSALSIFNESIVRAAIRRGLPILDLRFLCADARDYSAISPIEPSEIGGAKIAQAIVRVLNVHDFSQTETVIYRD